MDYTPFAALSDQEFITHLASKANPTDEDIEAMLRLERFLAMVDDLSAALEQSALIRRSAKENVPPEHRQPELLEGADCGDNSGG